MLHFDEVWALILKSMTIKNKKEINHQIF